jgi:hypothetical protein
MAGSVSAIAGFCCGGGGIMYMRMDFGEEMLGVEDTGGI